MQSKTLTGGQALVRLLANYGVDTVFGIPGVHTLELYRGLPGSGIRHVLTRHEQGASFMADGYARVSGKPGRVLRHHRPRRDQRRHRHRPGLRRLDSDAGDFQRQPHAPASARAGAACTSARTSAR